jgi:ABC-type nitrate/sulfonate/bicarbonate transport system ATPase subunit
MTAQGKDLTPVLQVVGLRKSYGDHLALSGVDLEVHAREVVAVLGPSGSGKSTLVRCIDQLESIEGGAIYLDGQLLGYERHRDGIRPLTDTEVQRQRRRMGMVFQQFNLFPHWTVLRNITEAPVKVHGRRRSSAPWSSSPASGSPTRPMRTRASSRAVSSSASRSPEPSRRVPASCSSTSPPARWTPSSSTRCCR